MRPRLVITAATAAFLCGCAGPGDFNYAGLKNVARLSGEQSRLGRYVLKQSRGFELLKKDIARGALKPGLPLRQLIRVYGEPLARTKDGALVYRHPVDALSLPLVYLYLDDREKLVSWSVLE